MPYMTPAIARNIAESLWGTGGTSASKTTRKGVYYFDCAGHGGYVLPASVLSKSEYEAVSEYVKPEVAKVYGSTVDGKIVYMHPYRTRSSRLAAPLTTTEEEFFVFEEDCDWTVLEKFTGIRLKEPLDDPKRDRARERIFWEWHDRNNPAVLNREEEAEKRKNGDPDLIVSALGKGDGLVEVVTADQNRYMVKGYDQARNQFGTPYLSNCQVINA